MDSQVLVQVEVAGQVGELDAATSNVFAPDVSMILADRVSPRPLITGTVSDASNDCSSPKQSLGNGSAAEAGAGSDTACYETSVLAADHVFETVQVKVESEDSTFALSDAVAAPSSESQSGHQAGPPENARTVADDHPPTVMEDDDCRSQQGSEKRKRREAEGTPPKKVRSEAEDEAPSEQAASETPLEGDQPDPSPSPLLSAEEQAVVQAFCQISVPDWLVQ